MTTTVHALHPHFAAQRLSLRASVRIAFRRADGRFRTRRFGFIVSAWIVPGTTIEHRSAGPRLWGPGRPISTTTFLKFGAPTAIDSSLHSSPFGRG